MSSVHLKYNSLKEEVSQACENVGKFWENVIG